MTTSQPLTPLDFESAAGIALVTGGSGGIGSAISRLLVANGARVALTYRNNVPTNLLSELGSSADGHQLDLTDSDSCLSLVNVLQTRYGSIHTLVHAAGPYVELKYISAITPAEFAHQVNEDLISFFNITSAVLPVMRSTGGSITAVTSAATHRYPARDALSAAPKGGIEALVRGIAHEEGRFGIRANCVGPGMLTDGMSEKLIATGLLNEAALDVSMRSIPLRKFGRADDIAQAVAFLSSHRAGFISGQKLDIDGGYGA